MSISMDVENVARMKPTHEIIAPEMQTARHPNRFTMALANGPVTHEPEIESGTLNIKTQRKDLKVNSSKIFNIIIQQCVFF